MFWVTVANRTLDWQDEAGLEALRRSGQAPGLDARALGEAVAVLRAAAAHRMLTPDSTPPPAVSQWLATVTLEIGTGERIAGLALPGLRAARRNSQLPRAVEELLSTALVQLLVTPSVVTRCAGIVRARQAPFDAASERAFAQHAGLTPYLGPGLAQCAQLVAGPRAGQYCSKACSNAAFALRKAARDPDYFARKQARYRDAKRRAAARIESAFAFVD
jgi:hypothetical protein